MSTYTQTLEETSLDCLWRTNIPRAASPSHQEPQRPSAILSMERLEAMADAYFCKKARRQLLERVGPAALVITFVEDAFRVVMRYDEQRDFLTEQRGFYVWAAYMVLFLSFSTQLAGATCVLGRFDPSRVKLGSYLLLSFTAVQPFVYGTHADMDFMTRALTLSGGFLLLIFGENDKLGKRTDMMSMKHVHEIESAASDKLQLAGRLLLTFLFLFQSVHSEHGGLHSVIAAPSFINVLSMLVLVVCSLMVCTGFRTELSSIALTGVLGLSAVTMYPFWSAPAHLVDFYRYYFFQTASIMGGLMLLTLHGPGGLSLDGQKKKL